MSAKRLVVLTFLTVVGYGAIFVSGAVGAPSTLPYGTPPGGSGTIQLDGFVRVASGDTLDGRFSRGHFLIGVVGIQSPRANTSCGREAMAFAQDLVLEGAVLSEEPGVVFDGRSRRMYHVTTLDGRSVAEELVAAGFAQASGGSSNSERLKELETEARQAERGCVWKQGAR